jgi:hypothetical protein
MKGSDVFPSKWLKAADLNGEEWTLTIASVLYEEIAPGEQKPVIHFKGAKKGMICNVTNWKRLRHFFRSDESDDWIGQPITIYVEQVDMRGEMVDALRLKAATKRNGKTVADPSYQTSSGPSATPVRQQAPADPDLDDSIPF